jgi:putative transposase
MFNFELSIMKRIKFSESQIIKILNEYESGREVKDLCREYGISRATFYNWKKKFTGMDASQLKRLKELEEENRRLKRMYADLSLDHHMLKDVLGKKF